jgi:hypothetical protein
MKSVSFTQTYENRKDLLEIYLKDKKLHELKNHFDINIYSFHNCPVEYIKWFEKVNPVKNSVYFSWIGLPYTLTIKKLVEFLKKENVTHFFFSQDDTFSWQNDDIDFGEFYNYFTEKNSNTMISLDHTLDYPIISLNNVKPSEIHKSFNIWHFTSAHHGYNKWGMNDSPYLSTTDLVYDIYDEEYFLQRDIWKAERVIGLRYKKKIIPRWTTNYALFRNYNIKGHTLFDRDFFLRVLKKKKFID